MYTVSVYIYIYDVNILIIFQLSNGRCCSACWALGVGVGPTGRTSGGVVKGMTFMV